MINVEMSGPIFDKRPIAVIWDFDKTLIEGSMQRPLFKRFGVKEGDFWDEADDLPEFYEKQGLDLVSDDTLYLNHILAYVRAGKFEGLSNQMLTELGAELEFYPGVEKFLARTKKMVAENKAYAEHGITLEHYVISTGLRRMILGSKINELLDGVWGCEFAERVAGPGYRDGSAEGGQEATEPGEIQEIVYTINNTTKTRAVFEINKGANVEDSIKVNVSIDPADRRVPFENMIYVADGPSDVPVFSILNQYGGQTYAVYSPKSDTEFAQVFELNRQDRVNAFGPADYRKKKQSARWIETAITNVAERMVRERVDQRQASVAARVGSAPGHIKS
ncbi:MAG: hypothetical protein QOI31_1744 [Solirubrobacterales bacterium]|nr:hypothetical protein [Solirubrobacterales bacterium]